jgi:hypothetical protein
VFPFVLGLLILVSSGLADAQQSIRQVDFENFTYPLNGPVLAHDRLEWLDASKPGHLKLVKGNGASGVGGFTLDSVRYEDVTGDGQEDAIVVIHFKTGGTQPSD